MTKIIVIIIIIKIVFYTFKKILVAITFLFLDLLSTPTSLFDNIIKKKN